MIYLGRQIDANVGRRKQNNCVNMFAHPYICIWGGGQGAVGGKKHE